MNEVSLTDAYALCFDANVLFLVLQVFTCIVVFENPDSYSSEVNATALRKAGIELLEAMEKDPSFESYWSDPRVVETHAVWARMYMATSQVRVAGMSISYYYITLNNIYI